MTQDLGDNDFGPILPEGTKSAADEAKRQEALLRSGSRRAQQGGGETTITQQQCSGPSEGLRSLYG